MDRNGKNYSQHATGLLAVCIQHEIDHLNGVVFVDYLSSLKRERIRRELRGKRISSEEIAQIHQNNKARYHKQTI
jgi:peptide deformylase